MDSIKTAEIRHLTVKEVVAGVFYKMCFCSLLLCCRRSTPNRINVKGKPSTKDRKWVDLVQLPGGSSGESSHCLGQSSGDCVYVNGGDRLCVRSMCACICLFVRSSVRSFVCLFVCLSVCLFVQLFVWLLVC